jgi:hypothetical protein
MPDKIDLGNGEWAKLREPKEVRERDRRPLEKVQRSLLGSGLGDALIERAQAGVENVSEAEMVELLRPHLADDAMDLISDADDLLIKALVEEWSYETPITVETIQDLPGRAYDALKEACGPLLNAVLGNEGGEEEIHNPASPTTPGSG